MKKQTIKTTYSSGYTYPQPFNPQVHIAVKNNRMKTYDHEGEKRIYLDDETEFQLEFYNDSSYYAKAVIEINGVVQNSALVLRPYQRFYLDRFMNEQKRLKFNTFMTGNDDIEKLKEIIEKNGRIKVEFYKQYVPQPIVSWTTITEEEDIQPYYPYHPWSTTGGQQYGGTLTSGQINTCNNLSRGSSLGMSEDYSAKTLNKSKKNKISPDSVNAFNSQRVEEPKEIETGRVEAGSKSDQDFVQSYETFEILPTLTFEYHIVPVSQKPVQQVIRMKTTKKSKDVIVTDGIRTYCPDCGRRVKKGWQYCAGCGYKF